MTKEDRDLLRARYAAIGDELFAIAEARVADRPSAVEILLRMELDAIDYQLASARDN